MVCASQAGQGLAQTTTSSNETGRWGIALFMQPLVRAAVFAALVAAVGMFGLTKSKTVVPVPQVVDRPAAPPVTSACGPFQIPEGEVCLPIPRSGQTADPGGLDHVPRALRERGESIPRRPERPAEVAGYRFPLAESVKPVLLAGLDLPEGTMPDVDVASTAALLGATNGEQVVVVMLEGQEGPAEIAFVGELVGQTVVTLHMVREGGRLRQIMLVHGYLGRFGDHVIEGSSVDEGDVLGYVGSLPTGRDVLYVEARQVREGTNLGALSPDKLLETAVSVPCDVRNVLRHGASL